MGKVMQGKTVVMTGATSGLGEAAAIKLAQMGARIVMIARSESRAKATLARLEASGQGQAHSVHYADLTRISGMKCAAAGISQAEARIDVLVNNAGAIFDKPQLTEDGIERTFALNHMAYFVVTEGLRERLLASAPARIVNTASVMHAKADLDFSDLQSLKNYAPLKAYARSKLCNILFTRELARRLQGTGVTANCFHPGFTATRIGDESGGLISRFAWLAKYFAISPEKGAETLIYLASSPEAAKTTGAYFYQCRREAPSLAAQDDEAARQLWERSAGLAGLKTL
jgi:NAD(P)-dependent dehydrogenase (short-subunit alcohol dehydrogenase family)